MDATQLAYLEAMGIDVWQPRRETRDAAPGDLQDVWINLHGGDGDIICIADSAEDANSGLAKDISKAMRCMPAWGWPADVVGEAHQATTVQAAVGDRLVTRVLVFGRHAAGALFGDNVPEVLGAARVHLVPGLERLGKDRDAKRILWKLMCDEGIAGPTSK